MSAFNSHIYLLCLVMFVLLLSGSRAELFSQEIRIEENSDWRVEEFTLPGGTNGNLVTAISEGPNGFMWFASFGGLHRFDGNEFITYNDVGADSITASTGLPFPNLEHLFWDREGQLWISTFGSGAYHFDPNTEIFTNYKHDPNDSLSIAHEFVHFAAQDAEGSIWFATRTGACKLDRSTGTFERYKTDISKPLSDQNNNVRVLYLDRQGTLWAASGEVYAESLQGGLFRFNSNLDEFEGFFPNPTEAGGLGYAPIRGMYEDSDNNFWVGTFYGLQRMDRQQGTFTNMPYNPSQPHAPDVNNREVAPVWSFHEDQNKGLWMGTVSFVNHDKNLSRYDPISGTTETFPVSTMAWGISESTDGTIWVAGSAIQGHVSRLSRQKKKYQLQDGEGVLAAMREFTSAMVINSTSEFNNVFFDPKTNTTWATRSARDQDQSRILLVAFDNNTEQSKHYWINEVYDEMININFSSVGLEMDNSGNIWLPASGGGIISYNPDTGDSQRFLHDPEDSTSLSSNHIVKMILDSRGDIWAASHLQGLNRINSKTGEVKRYNLDMVKSHQRTTGGLSSNFPIALLEDKDGKIWIGGSHLVSDNLGMTSLLCTIDPRTDEIDYIPLPERIEIYSIRNLTQDPVTGKIAFSLFQYGFGIYNPDSEEFKIYDNSDGTSPFRNIASLLFDDHGYLWISNFNTNEFARMDLADDNIYLFESDRDITYNSHNRHGIKTDEGHLIFKNDFGWARIDPNQIQSTGAIRVAQIKLVDLSVSGERQNYSNHSTLDTIISETEHIHLNHTAESFQLKFSDFNFSPTQTTYHYRLHPYEEEYRQATNGPVASYFKIPAGKYQFEVKGASSKGAIIEPLSVGLTIHPPWWKTWWAYALYGIAFLAGAWMIHKTQKARTIRKEREKIKDQELAHAKEIEKAYSDLKATQAQLIQSEKMASLGELTAGIAHEIQNPLNFVNNFSEVSSELIVEAKEELEKGDLSEVKDILDDLNQNLEKITHHGGRASSIVKGMLDHSRESSGEKELTDINALCDEYIRLSYHGLRARDKSFNAEFELNLDENLPKIMVIPQDIGRVLLNILNNAFYAVDRKNKQNHKPNYGPKVIIKSVPLEGEKGVEITISDNGTGMSKESLEKVFQPFFTTKPTGQGTGLGMSISYDIVTKGHGGELNVESEEDKGTIFKIILPQSNG